MADALCGPSNALQNFQKHTSVDRTLQQDRLSSRQSPTQGFRSSLGPNVGALDPEFDAFQAGHAGPPQPTLQHFPPPHLSNHTSLPHFAHAQGGPEWASDFQRLNLGPSHPTHVQHHQPVQPSNAAASWHQDFLNQGPAMQNPSYMTRPFGGMPGAGMSAYARPTFQGFGGVNRMPVQEVANGKQRAQEDVPKFDDAAFERAFEQAQKDMAAGMEELEVPVERREDMGERIQKDQKPHPLQDFQMELELLGELNRIVALEAAGNVEEAMVSETHARKLRIDWLTAKAQLSRVQLNDSQIKTIAAKVDTEPLFNEARNASESLHAISRSLGQEMQRVLLEQRNQQQLAAARQEQSDTNAMSETNPVLLRIREKRPSVYETIKLRSEIELGRSAEALQHLGGLENMESRGMLTADASEAKWCVDTLQRILNRDAPQEVKGRIETLIKAINERLMSSYPLLATGVPIRQENIWNELRVAGYSTPDNPAVEREYEQQEQNQEQQSQRNDDDVMAETAGQLLERVADNTSEKFQNSQFLELMRRLRDREVRVEGDKVVEVSTQSSVSLLPSATSISAPPEIDPHILDHAVQEFGMPVDSEQEIHYSRHSSTEPPTDETSGQFSYYNVNASYHQ